ncbi:arylsulfatase [Pelagicoccus sp. SDUM812005]|uniref:arylsulfatase n=1 Tax=Pelagicoccus sp. SDUM812005 TaxID=3041257 RepID=UPI00280FFF91|nr:arylsulfatase [Pelagicoccus sp. SDUM812005]MDQ8181427.1 arylsulfatase [Pelagicoccus sp. SDUM812005]
MLSRSRILLFITITLSCLAAAAQAETKDQRPNIVYILADDLGYGDLGCYGQKMIATPNIDRLAQEGMKFTQHYAGNAVCTPSRSSLLTGKHPGNVRHRDNPRFVDSYGFLPQETTFAEAMKEAGYATAITGKWHVGDRNDTEDIAPYHGFDYNYCVGFPYPEGGVEHWPSHLFENGKMVKIPENQNGQRGAYMDDLYTDAAIRFLNERDNEKPFILFLSFQGVHVPMDGKISPDYANKDWPEVEKVFASMLQNLDTNTGRFLKELETQGLAKNTVVFFTSDNGPHLEGGHDHRFFNSNGPLRGAKRDLLEGGIRVPLIVRWPDIVPQHSQSDHVSAFWDMLPTFVDIAGEPLPADTDGISFLPTLTGNKQEKHAFLYWENQEYGGQQAVLENDWKLYRKGIIDNSNAEWELYNITSDPAELHDIASKYPQVVRQLSRRASDSHTPSPIAPLFK